LRELKGRDVRALQILHERFRKQLQFVHQARWQALWRVVSALIAGRQLWLTALGRALPGSAMRKHAIKAVDRLLGNAHLHAERFSIAAALASTIIRDGSRPIVLIDTVEIRHKIVAITAAIAHDGRSFPIWSTIVSHVRPKARECSRFLQELSRVLPVCHPVLVTDAGFEGPWFIEVERHGWDYVGRLRGQVMVQYDDRWVRLSELRQLATNRAQNLGRLLISKKGSPAKRRVVLSKLPTCGHRQVKTRRGPARGTNYRVYRANAYEPLVLVSSLTSEPRRVVAVYKLRMQIEQAFRDLKNHRWGWSLRHCGTGSRPRLEILLLIGAIAQLVQQLVGIAAERMGLHRAHQANTIRQRRVLSVFVLGGLILNNLGSDDVSKLNIAAAIKRVRDGARCRST
jgi:hypothetical protein